MHPTLPAPANLPVPMGTREFGRLYAADPALAHRLLTDLQAYQERKDQAAEARGAETTALATYQATLDEARVMLRGGR